MNCNQSSACEPRAPAKHIHKTNQAPSGSGLRSPFTGPPFNSESFPSCRRFRFELGVCAKDEPRPDPGRTPGGSEALVGDAGELGLNLGPSAALDGARSDRDGRWIEPCLDGVLNGGVQSMDFPQPNSAWRGGLVCDHMVFYFSALRFRGSVPTKPGGCPVTSRAERGKVWPFVSRGNERIHVTESCFVSTID